MQAETHVRMPRIIYGTAWKKGDTERLVKTAIQQGFRGLDTACQPRHYDEPGVGAGVAACLQGELLRRDLYLQTKFTSVSGQDPKTIPYDPKAPLPDQVAQSFAASLRNLQTSYVDCLILHSPLRTAGQTLEAWRAMESLVAGGAVRQLGISNCDGPEQLAALYASARTKPAVVQNRFHGDTDYDRGIRAFCRQHDVTYQSFWTLTANPQVLAHPAITALAASYGRTPAQIFFRYTTQRDIVPLTGTRSEVHMREDLAIVDFELTDGELGSVDAIL